MHGELCNWQGGRGGEVRGGGGREGGSPEGAHNSQLQYLYSVFLVWENGTLLIRLLFTPL